MALDEAISESVRNRISPPTLRIYRWERPSISIGYFQKASDIDLDYCSSKGYPFVRRMTGGRAILHDAEITYSLSSSTDSFLFRDSLTETYNTISNALLRSLTIHGINAGISFRKKRSANHKNPSCFEALSYGEITVEKKKIIGSAQRRYKNGFLQHGSILFKYNASELGKIFKTDGKEDFLGMGAVQDYSPNVSVDNFVMSMKQAFETELNVKMITDVPTRFELKLARNLEFDKYATQAWNFRR